AADSAEVRDWRDAPLAVHPVEHGRQLAAEPLPPAPLVLHVERRVSPGVPVLRRVTVRYPLLEQLPRRLVRVAGVAAPDDVEREVLRVRPVANDEILRVSGHRQ